MQLRFCFAGSIVESIANDLPSFWPNRTYIRSNGRYRSDWWKVEQTGRNAYFTNFLDINGMYNRFDVFQRRSK